MSSIREIEVKGWCRDGVENWTVGLKLDFDGLQPEIPSHAIETLNRSVESAKDAIRKSIAPQAAPRAVPAGEPYNAMAKGWNCCPTCGNADINKTSRDGARHYQCCARCRVYLNADGTVKEMKQ